MRLPIMAAYFVGALLLRAAQSQVAIVPIGSVRVALSRAFNTRDLTPGDILHLHTLDPLQAADCTLGKGTEIVGHVETVKRAPEGPARITVALRFDPVKCPGKQEQKILPLLVAVQSRSVQDNPGHVPVSTAAFQFLVSARQTTIGATPNNNVMLATRDAMSAGTRVDDALTAGQVEGIHGLQLRLPAITPITTLIFSQDKTLQSLDTTLYLAFVPTSSTAIAVASHRALEEPEACVAPGCSSLIPPTSALGNDHLLWSAALTPLGFVPRPDQMAADIKHTVSLHFLGPDQVLLSFPLYPVLQRGPRPAFDARPRLMRAVLLSRQDGHVLKTADWQTSETQSPVSQTPEAQQPYLWRFGRDTVLAQIGRELVLFGRNLEPERRFPLPGLLASLTAAPSGESILLTTVHEKHTPKEHQKMMSRLGPDQPLDEDYELTALDAHLSVVASRMLHVPAPQLTLLSSGTVSTQLLSTDIWQISKTNASGTNTVLATVQSTCPLHVRSLRGNLILVEGCGAGRLPSTWYRVANDKGATLLAGRYDSHALLLQAEMDPSGSHFGIASLPLDPPTKAGPSLHTRDSLNESIAVYRSTTGELQFATTVAADSAQQDSFAISPDGEVLTVLSGGQVQSFLLPGK